MNCMYTIDHHWRLTVNSEKQHLPLRFRCHPLMEEEEAAKQAEAEAAKNYGFR